MKTEKNPSADLGTKVNTAELPIEEWKDKHKVVKLIKVAKKDGTIHEFVIGRPTLTVMDMIGKYLNDGKPHKMREVLRNNCILAGDKTLIDTDDDIRNTVFERITELFEKLEVEEKEL